MHFLQKQRPAGVNMAANSLIIRHFGSLLFHQLQKNDFHLIVQDGFIPVSSKKEDTKTGKPLSLRRFHRNQNLVT